MESTIWKFVNKTNGKKIESDDLNYLLYRLRDDKGLDLPEHADVDLIIKGRLECTVLDEEGVKHDIVIGEHDPSRGVYFQVDSTLN